MAAAVLEERTLEGKDDEARRLFATMDVLLIQDGGCAPGYNPVTAFVVAHMERFGRRCYAAHAGFRSLVSNEDFDYRRTIYNRAIYKREEHIPGVLDISSLSDASGARFRSERYPEFAQDDLEYLSDPQSLAVSLAAVHAKEYSLGLMNAHVRFRLESNLLEHASVRREGALDGPARVGLHNEVREKAGVSILQGHVPLMDALDRPLTGARVCQAQKLLFELDRSAPVLFRS